MSLDSLGGMNNYQIERHQFIYKRNLQSIHQLTFDAII